MTATVAAASVAAPVPPEAFHRGEQALQARVGVRERMAAVGAMVLRDHMPDQHRELFEKLPTLLLGALDASGQPWATMLAGPPGFVHTPHAQRMDIAAAIDPADPADPALAALAAHGTGAPVGVLGLEPHTRRRNRMNGRVAAFGDSGLDVQVVQSFGNCPKYIQRRHLRQAAQQTQEQLAATLGVRQDTISRLEKRSDMLLSTLRHYIESMGGKLELVAQFPNRPPVVIEHLGVNAGSDHKPAGSEAVSFSAVTERRVKMHRI